MCSVPMFKHNSVDSNERIVLNFKLKIFDRVKLCTNVTLLTAGLTYFIKFKKN